ncbi:flagellar hook-associated protein FlgL [Solibacillus sp. A46]|uniref:Flagellar hook-associated protein FlgL n=1 Tax=Solibacillus faecavium TaxID=2762221 RepID=A0ABR8XUU6_9BACL|nr:flagellar hook-associated protein FlgL [Solibacillus faecavium]MBD8035718.1 flagellar hook-associated protein FlgL [Solibacillus faecavium]
MRVTQSMLSSNMLRNLNNSYNKMAKYQEQLNSGSIINRPSDDPVVAVKGMGYRVDLDKNQQYQRNLNQANTWLDGTDEALDQVGTSLIRVKELIIQAANDTNTPEDRQKINEEISQIRQHLQDLGNTKVGENYIFSGTHTNDPLFVNDAINPKFTPVPDRIAVPNAPLVATEKSIDINVFDGIKMQINTEGVGLFKEINTFMTGLENLLKDNTTTGTDIGNALGVDLIAGGNPAIPGLDSLNEKVLVKRAEVGAKQNRVELMESRLQMQEVNVTKQMSLNEDTDYAKTITEMVTAESIHQASLSVGAKIIQQTLVDFIR